jgi:hypothetical protein
MEHVDSHDKTSEESKGAAPKQVPFLTISHVSRGTLGHFGDVCEHQIGDSDKFKKAQNIPKSSN